MWSNYHQGIHIFSHFRFNKLFLYLGFTPSDVPNLKVCGQCLYVAVLHCVMQIHLFCKMISDFSLEYRTLYSKMLQRNEKRKRKTGVLIPTVSFIAFTRPACACNILSIGLTASGEIKWLPNLPHVALWGRLNLTKDYCFIRLTSLFQ